MQPGPLNAARLPPGTHVGPWRIIDLRGWGAYGAVYLAEGVEPEATGEVALKLALAPRDERFPREVGLLSRVSHPCIPRLIGQGQWLSPFGLPHPYVVMEWVEGIPLYVWARDLDPSSRKVLGVLAGVARALESIHSMGAVHRDVKGDNVLVRLPDGRGFLTDFGSSYYQGAATLTWQVFPPGTQPYRSPEAYQFALNIHTAPVKVYAPGPADDLFALGVTAYRLVTGQYPPEPQPLEAELHLWSPGSPGPRPARELNPSCSPELSALISQMLSVHPEARGSARELAEALEQAAREAGPEADVPLSVRKASRPAEVSEVVSWRVLPKTPRTAEAGPRSLRLPEEAPLPLAEEEAIPPRIHSSEHGMVWQAWLAAGIASLVTLGAPWVLGLWDRAATTQEARDAGTVAVGDSSMMASVDSAEAPAMEPSIAVDMPSQPLPGQLRPDASGRCRYKPQVPINGGCWLKVNLDLTECKTSEYSYVYKGACYQVGQPPPRPATSSPAESRDGG